jgi:hypothetical protein
VAGTWVQKRGFARKVTARAAGSQLGGVVGSVAAGAIGGGRDQTSLDTPTFGRDAYLAASDQEIALVKTKQGPFKLKISQETIAREPVTRVVAASVGDGKLACPITIEFDTGARWEFDVPRAGRKAAQQLVATLSAGTGASGRP